jgi:hypothetical protein
MTVLFVIDVRSHHDLFRAAGQPIADADAGVDQTAQQPLQAGGNMEGKEVRLWHRRFGLFSR